MTHSIRPAINGFASPATAGNAEHLQAFEEVNLNDILGRSMKKMETEYGQVSLIQKFDKLPVVKGRKEYLTLLFEALLSMVYSLPPVNTKSLLYIQCTEDRVDRDIMDLSTRHEASFSICFHTNIRTCESWMQLNQTKLEEAYIIASKISGSLAHYNITKTGCLFSLKISGKIL